uniref:Uncharacterized protein n=1 Tax=Anopheles stephensi TaxID=30069 RepID=A0A182YSG9_ANOST
MLPSYESFAIATEQQPVGAAGFVTERRKSPSDGTSIDPVPALPTPEHGVGIISDRELREIEQMYVELKATSEMSEKLIRAMRLSKQKAATPQQDQTMRQACQKLKKWYDRSMNAFTRSMRILGNIQRATGGGLNAANDRSRAACPSPLSHEQQRTVNEFNSSTDRFRSMLAQLHSTINDSDVENHPPPPPTIDAESTAPSKGPSLSATKKVQILQDIIILPARSDAAKRNPLMPLNVVPLPQRDSPVMSPLAKPPTNPGPRDASCGPNNTRRELQYDKENELSTNIVDKDLQPVDTGTTTQPPGGAPSVVEINDDTAMHGDGSGHSGHKHLPATTDHNSRDYFGFDDNSGNSDGVVESSLAQVTLPMPLNISHETLERRLQTVKQLLPKRPIFRARPKQQNPRSSGPTRFPVVPKLCVIGSPQKRPHTLRDFVASTPRAVAGGVSSKEPPNEAPDVSAIEPIAAEQQPQSEKQAERNNESDVVALFDTPDRPAWLNNSAHQRTYSRIPKRRKKKNIYLANLGLDDDSEDEENDEPEELSSDSESDRKKKAKQKARRKKQIPVEETKDFKQFVDSFNSMCEQVERYEMIVE